jgi:hypothetical protein
LPLFLKASIPASLVGGFDILVIAAFLTRLQSRWKVWDKAMKSIVSQWPATAWKLMIRMADEEIEWLSALPYDRVLQEVEKKALADWRWSYFLTLLQEDRGRP